MNIRCEAARVLAPVLKGEQSLQALFEKAIAALEVRERPLFHELVYGCLRHYEFLQALSSALIEKKLKNKDSDVHALILLGLYQLKMMRIPQHAALSETVTAASKLKKPWAKNLVNAVLRRYLREQEQLDATAEANPSAQYRTPAWLLGKLKKNWPQHWSSVVEQQSEQAPLTARINLHKQDRQEAIKALQSAGLEVEACEFSRYGLRIHGSNDIPKLPGYIEAWLSIQDEAAQLAADLLELAPGQRVLDACSAPGGKTCHILEAEPQLKHVSALEIDEARSLRIQENLERLGLTANIHVADGIEIDHWWDGRQFDRILLDAPCSATGVIRRHPDIKLLRRPDDLDKLGEIQAALLASLWRTLRPGGILVYATCSVLKQENDTVVKRFVDQNDEAEVIEIEAEWGLEQECGRQLFPQKNGHDGFYYAKLRKLITA